MHLAAERNNLEILHFLLFQEEIQVNADAFIGCQKLTGLSNPPGVTTIGKHAFRDCLSLTEVEFPSTVETLVIWPS